MTRADFFRFAAPKLGAVEGCLLTKRAKALHWLLFPITTLSWSLLEKNGFCPQSYSLIVAGKRLGIPAFKQITDGNAYKVKCDDGVITVERIYE